MERLPAGTTSERLNIRLWRVDEAEALSTAINESLAHLQPWMDWAAEPASPGRGSGGDRIVAPAVARR